MSDSIVIDVGETAYEIRPFTVQQTEDLHVHGLEFEAMTSEENTRKYYARCLNVIAAALAADHPEVTAETLRKTRLGTFPEITAKVRKILVFSGIWKEVPPGEVAPKGEASAAPSTGIN
jgi:hypothetical protein